MSVEITKEESEIKLRRWKDRMLAAGCHCHGPEPHKCYLVQVGGADPDWYKSRVCDCRCHIPCTCVHCKLRKASKVRRES